MAKNAQNSWVGVQYQPQMPTYQTAGMLQPRTPSQPPAPPPPPPPPTPTPTTGGTGGTGGSGGSGDLMAGSGSVLNLAPTVPVVQQPALQPPTTNEPERDRLVNALITSGLQFMEQ